MTKGMQPVPILEDPLDAARIAHRVTEFWAQVDRSAGPDACWPWTGYIEKGYGGVYWNGRMVGAHELAVTFTTGEVRDESLDTCHSCHTPLCCNPAHLRFDTRQGNVDDMTEAGRQARGSKNGSARLTEADVLTIRIRAANGATGRSLAEEYGMSAAGITMIVRGQNWQHVGGPIREQHGNRRHGKYAKKSTEDQET